MKQKAPQRELALPDEPFALIPQTAIDGDRVACESWKRLLDRATAERRQSLLPEPPTSNPKPNNET